MRIFADTRQYYIASGCQCLYSDWLERLRLYLVARTFPDAFALLAVPNAACPSCGYLPVREFNLENVLAALCDAGFEFAAERLFARTN